MKNTLKRCALVATLLLLVIGLVVAAFPAAAQSVNPSSISLGASKTLSLTVGSSLTLTPTLKPANATTTYSFKSSNKGVAKVSSKGVVTGVKAGAATVTVTTKNGKKASVKIKVTDPYLPKSVKLSQKGTVKLPLGDRLTLSATLSPATARSSLKWRSSKTSVAKVSAGGVVTARKVGSATITVTTRNGKKAKVKIKVTDPYKPASVKLDQLGTQSVVVGQKLQLTATLSPSTAKSSLTWKSSNKKIATVSSKGVVTGKKTGSATITVTTRNGKKAKIKVKVIAKAYGAITTPADYALPYVVYASKYSHTLAVIAKDDNGNWTRTIRLFSMGTGKEGNTDVGTFTIAKKERWHKWTYGYSPYSNRLSVGIHIHGPLYESKNNNAMYTRQYNGIGTDVTAGCLRCTSGGSAWIYYNCPIGTQVIIANDSRFYTAPPTKLKSGVTTDPTDPGNNPEVLIASFSVTPESLTMNVGASQTLYPTALEPSNASTKSFTYWSSNEGVAKVSSKGVVTAVGNGTAVIVVTANDAMKARAYANVTVGGASAAAALAEAGADIEPDEALSLDQTIDADAEVSVEENPTAQEPDIDAADAEFAAVDEAISDAAVATDAPESVDDAEPEDTIDEIPESALEYGTEDDESVVDAAEALTFDVEYAAEVPEAPVIED